MSSDLRSPTPDHAAMRARLNAAEQAWLAGQPLTPVQQRIIAMVLHAGGCPSGGGQDG